LRKREKTFLRVDTSIRILLHKEKLTGRNNFVSIHIKKGSARKFDIDTRILEGGGHDRKREGEDRKGETE